eukprot:TRINITY_DN2111_c0_g1_i4.p1 TRINITY_DN2111_c0_g1~~TRINITY_DN2111_c0_g1_i4.p1  ORF type:complete len:596 (-),score=58.34 TRINITY_DN2111_c0_g1_i4:1858-3645(-)
MDTTLAEPLVAPAKAGTSQTTPETKQSPAKLAAGVVIGVIAAVCIIGLTVYGISEANRRNESVSSDPNYPTYHIRPEYGWINDPNGLSYIDGVYHVFFQYNPYGVAWNFTIHWGHAVSTDLVHWELLPVALAPSDLGADCAGCWSGGMTIDEQGVPTIIYTGVTLKGDECLVTEEQANWTSNPELAYREAVMWAQPDLTKDTTELIQWPTRGILLPGPPGDMRLQGWRDPFMYQRGNKNSGDDFILLVGTGLMNLTTSQGLGGAIMAYTAPKMFPTSDWSYQGIAVSGPPDDALMWECPWMVEITPEVGSSKYSHILGLSANMWQDTHPRQIRNPLIYFFGNFDETTMKFTKASDNYTKLDIGNLLYAANRMVLDNGEILIWGWLTECDYMPDYHCDGTTYAGAISLPRILKVQDDNLIQQVPQEIYNLRTKQLYVSSNVNVPANTFVETMQGSYYHYEAKLQFKRIDAQASGLLFARGNESMLLAYNWEANYLCTFSATQDTLMDIDPTSLDNGVKCIGGPLHAMKDKSIITFDVFVDGSSIEIFTSAGQVASVRLYFDKSVKNPQENIKLYSFGGSSILVEGAVWEMGTIWNK